MVCDNMGHYAMILVQYGMALKMVLAPYSMR
jgi:hypothetical protein